MLRLSVAAAVIIVGTAIVLDQPHAQVSVTPAAGACARLSSLKLRNVTITLAQDVAAGAMPAPAGRGRGAGAAPVAGAGPAVNPNADLPGFCRVTATLTPSRDSDIRMELWMPAANWNGRFRGTGNGGLGGGATPNQGPLAAGLRRGYAVAGHNTGHEGDSSYAMEHPEKIKDFGYRAAHETAVASKALLRAYYGVEPSASLMAESGGGTIAALSAAQRYPQDYDALAAVAMSSHLTRHTFGQMWMWMATHKDEASFIPPTKYPAIHAAALAACDNRDGLADGIIGDVEGCRFDPVVMQCKGADAADCLTAPQVEAARKLYAGPKHPRTGEQIYSPVYPGSELGWGQIPGAAEPLGIPVEFFRFYVFRDPTWDPRTRPINFDEDLRAADRADIQPVNAINPDLTRYFRRGGKLLLIGGWNDAAVPPKVAVDYYRNVVAKVGARAAAQSMRFFMVPGMAHGPGTTGAHNFNFDALPLIETWHASGHAPDSLIVDHYKDGLLVGHRLVCQYPQIAYYKGSGDPESPVSFACRTAR